MPTRSVPVIDYALLVLVALAADLVLETAASLANIHALRRPVPAGFEDLYPAEEYARSQAYARDRARLGMASRIFDLALLLSFWKLGGFAWVADLVAGYELSGAAGGVAFLGLIYLAKTLLDLPWSWYGTFVIEERYGFNRTSAGTFTGDLLKGLLLAALIGGPLVYLVLVFFERAGELAWLWAWALVSGVTLLLSFLAPIWIMPLFLKFSPLEDPELQDELLAYARKVGFPLTGVHVVDGSRRSSKANAFFTGFGRSRRVALFDTLLEKHPREEIIAVLAHEIGHYKRRHVIQGMVISILHTGVLLWLLGLVLSDVALYAAFGLDSVQLGAGLVFFGLLYTPVELVLGVAMSALSRRNEFQADAFARETTGDGGPLASALRRLSRDSLTNLTPHPLWVWLHASHPPLTERVHALDPG